ncbi:hypothetical protein VUJ49_06215 [Pseudomonas berkeleyensis]|uniref:Uncharacterized protein n=1 Tax=Pseudomonas berkeleyensis TaxID=2726956 RepID=A0A7G5DSC4_9PSED|nr:hypothetical protein [Pseudomonas berkeleyensis]QMV64649.1 hypothetical protein HS968_06190 [Pseudomonas berkeleyensis]WSO40117.1 hypothetical protein VUJ49_06215 [Pseudomonas berkeleyensis]
MITLEALEKFPRSKALACSIGAGGALGVLAYIGLRFYENNDAGFLSIVCVVSAIWLSLVSKHWNPLLGVKQLYLFDWPIVAALAWFMTINVPQLGHKLLIGMVMVVFATAGAVSARRKRARE